MEEVGERAEFLFSPCVDGPDFVVVRISNQINLVPVLVVVCLCLFGLFFRMKV